MLKRLWESVSEYLRINAVRRMLAIVEVRLGEVAALVAFAVLFAVFEGIGLSLLLPILQFAEGGRTAIIEGSGFIWATIAAFMRTVRLPVTLPALLMLAFVPILLRQVVYYFNAWYSATVAGRIAVRLRMGTLGHVLDADPEFFTNQALGRLVGILITQATAAGQAVLLVIKQVSIFLLMVLYVAILLAISAPLTLITLAFAVVVSVVVRTNIVRTRAFATESAHVSQEMTQKIVERLDMIRLIKLRDQKREEYDRVARFSETLRVLAVKAARLAANIEVTADPLLMLSAFVTLYVGIDRLDMSLAQLGLVLFVLNRLNAKVKEFNGARQAISQNMAGLQMVADITRRAKASNTIGRGTLPFTGMSSEIVLDDVSFEYPETVGVDGAVENSSKIALRGVNLTIPAGSFTALVGRSGGGKSTLVELLPRLRDVTSGTITFDGTDIREYDVGSLRRGIGYLTQTAVLFNDSVRENLVYGLGFEPSDEQIRAALEGAYATFVYDLPQGLETRIGDRGVRFSGGERQRIGLARVLLQDTSILVLDEPTSALDSESEGYIQHALARLHGVKTIIVIAHRLATVIQADQLLVVEDGRVIERGTHAELMGKGEAYQKLFESQLM